MRLTGVLFLAAALVLIAGCGGDTPPVERAAADRAAALPALETPYRAHGNEPFWALEIGADSMLFHTAEGESVAAALPAPDPVDGGRRYAGAGGALAVTILERPCSDGMSGMPYPHTVEVMAGGDTYSGCGGDPQALLTGAPWLVDTIGGEALIDTARATLHFTADGRVAGSTSCNSYTADYRLTGEGLAIGEAVMTRKACAPAQMNQEQRFMEALRAVDRFEVSSSGALVLHGGDRPRLVARRE